MNCEYFRNHILQKFRFEIGIPIQTLHSHAMLFCTIFATKQRKKYKMVYICQDQLFFSCDKRLTEMKTLYIHEIL